MKILDRYILFAFVKTFLSIFIILMFIFVLQSVWLYIQELAGRALDFNVILKFLFLVTPSLVSLVLPLSVLLTSIMTFGNFAENYEFAAMKSTGISLQRAMKSLIVFIIFLGIVSFLFANYVIPASQYEFRNLRRNIGKLKPAMIIRSGQFNPIGEDINILVAKKYGERDQYLTDVVIHQKEKGRIGNYTVINAKEGELISSLDSPVLSLKLTDGNYYSEIYQKDFKKRKKEPFAKSEFETYTLNIDLSALDDVDLDEKGIDNSYQMLPIKGLDSTLTVLEKNFVDDRQEYSETLYEKAGFAKLSTRFKANKKDSVSPIFLDNFKLNEQSKILEISKSNLANTIVDIENRRKRLTVDIRRLSKFEISIHDKYVLGFSCIILFFVGAPLGAIIRKGGLGLPIVIGVGAFLAFHFIGIFAKNSAEDGTLSPAFAAWLSTAIMLPIGVYLTYRATTDQGLFDLDGVIIPIKRFFAKKKNLTKDTAADHSFTITPEEEKMLSERSSNQLKDIVKNYRQYNYSEDIRNAAIAKLGELGVSIENLKVQGYYENKSYASAESNYADHVKFSKIALVFYGLLVLSLLSQILKLLYPTPFVSILTSVTLIIAAVSLIGYLVFYYITQNRLKSIFKLLSTQNAENFKFNNKNFGVWFYFITYFSNKKKLKRAMKEIF